MAQPAARGRGEVLPFRWRLRGIAAWIAYLVAFVSLTGGDPRPDFRGRLAVLRGSRRKDLETRRLEGMAAAHDRRFAALLLAARDALPPGTPGIALYAPEIPEWGGLYLGVYLFAPTPVLLAPPRVPPGWLVLAYGPAEPAAGRVVRRFADGALVDPHPNPYP
jgi:hypothetical protein